ncbi:MAG: CvpA family protein [Patescibacteria group bacterium]|jgi:membrane protein required for colicin V production
MSTIDIIIIIILALFIWKGVKLGLIEAVGGIIGLFMGAWLAGRYYAQAAEMIKGLLFGSEILANVLGFILVFIVINRGIALLFWIADRVFHIIAIIPFLKSINYFLGGIFGLIEGVIFIGIIVFFLTLVPFTEKFQEKIASSRFSGIFATVGKIADPFIPDTLIDLPFDLPNVGDTLKDINLSIPQMK